MSDAVQSEIRKRYGEAARRAAAKEKTSCCGGGKAVDLGQIGSTDPICRDLYDEGQQEGLPEEALLASFGCGNPTALIELKAGETVLDLGSGGGIDVLLSAKRVGPTGRAYGLDMTSEMLELARANQAKAGALNVEFLQGSIDAIPLANESVDVIISNCVINLAPCKEKVLREAFRVLKPGGRFAVSDMVLARPLEESEREAIHLWTGCISGALVKEDYLEKLAAAGFVEASIEVTRTYTEEDARKMAGQSSDSNGCATSDCSASSVGGGLSGNLSSSFIRATKAH